MKVVLSKVLKTPALEESKMYAAAEEEALKPGWQAATAAASSEKAAKGAVTRTSAWRRVRRNKTAGTPRLCPTPWRGPPPCDGSSRSVEACMTTANPRCSLARRGAARRRLCNSSRSSAGKSFERLNCHQHTETGDFLGGFRPTRSRCHDEDGDGKAPRGRA